MTSLALAGDRRVAVEVLRFLLDREVRPRMLLVSDPGRATHAEELRRLAGLPDDRILVGTEFRTPAGLAALAAAELDYIIGVHFPYLVPPEALAIPAVGFLNLHPAHLPHNRGWHTPSWAMLDGTPAGATLHFMDEGIDTGDIIARVRVDPAPHDTAHTFYQRILDAEVALFAETWPQLASLEPPRLPQRPDDGTTHRRTDLAAVRQLDADAPTTARRVVDHLRALTTSDPDEAAWIEIDGRRVRVRVELEDLD